METLKYQLALFEAILNSSRDGILVVDHKTGQIKQANSKFFELWNIPPELVHERDDSKILECGTSQLHNPNDFLKLVKFLYDNPTKTTFDQLQFKDGRTIERNSVPLLIENQVEGRIWYFRDITDKIKNELFIIHTSKMASLGEMAGGIAHEINNPITVIQSLARQIIFFLEKNQNFNLAIDKAKKISDVVDRIAKIVKGMRSFSRDGNKDEFVNVKIIAMIENTLSMCFEKFSFGGIKIDLSSVSNDLYVEMREAQVSQVLLNLLNNSYDAIEKNLEKWIKISTEIKNNMVVISITDSGKGLPLDIKEKIFQPFFTTKSIGKGTGLGLSISKNILEQHGGKLHYDSESPNTKFQIIIPCKQNQAKESL